MRSLCNYHRLDFTSVEIDHSTDCFLRNPFRHKPGDTMMRRLKETERN